MFHFLFVSIKKIPLFYLTHSLEAVCTPVPHIGNPCSNVIHNTSHSFMVTGFLGLIAKSCVVKTWANQKFVFLTSFSTEW